MSVTDAAMASSPGPLHVSGANVQDAQRAPGILASLGRSMDPTKARGTGDDDNGHIFRLFSIPRHPGLRGDGYQVVYALFSISLGRFGFRLRVLMGLTRGSLTLPRMNAHRLVIIAAAFTIAVAAALATALVTFSSQALPRARSGTTRAGATGTSFVDQRQRQQQPGGPQYKPRCWGPGKISAALEGTPFAYYRAYWSDPLGFVGSAPLRTA